MRFYPTYIMMIMLVFTTVMARAAGIEAIVNDSPITSFDVENRAKLILLQEGSQNALSDVVRKRALTQLVAEEVKMAEIKAKNMMVSSEDVERAIQHIEKQNALEPGYFDKEFQAREIDKETLQRQVATDLGWMRLMQMDMPEINISDRDVQKKKSELLAELKKDRYFVAEIVVKEEDKALEAWQKIQEGMSFPEAATTYSTAASKDVGGRVGWVEKKHYPQAVADVLTTMDAGQVSRPIEAEKKFWILGLLEKRPAAAGEEVEVWELAQAIVPETLTVKYKAGDELVGGCDEFKQVMTDYALPGSQERGAVSPYQLPAEMAQVLTDVPLKTIAGPIQTPVGRLYLMKCATERHNLMPSDEAIHAQLELEAMEKVSERLYQAAEKKAIIEYKE